MRIAFVQFAPKYLDVDANLEAVDRLVQDVNADLVVLPELFTSGYFFASQSDVDAAAEPIPSGSTTRHLESWARREGATFVAGLAESDGPHTYNSAVVVDPSGYAGTYRKVHLFNEEKRWFQPGDLGFPVFDAETTAGYSYRLGVMVCFDWYFPEAARSLVLNGADVIAHPSNLVLPHCPDSMPVRARENHVFTVTANRYGSESKGNTTLTFIGSSEICGPDGEVLVQADDEGDFVGIVNVDPLEARKRDINAYNNVLRDRRPDTYVTTDSNT